MIGSCDLTPAVHYRPRVTEAVAISPPKRSRSDYRASEDKVPCRTFNLAGLEDSLYIAEPGKRLYLDWLELAGEGAPMYDTLAPDGVAGLMLVGVTGAQLRAAIESKATRASTTERT